MGMNGKKPQPTIQQMFEDVLPKYLMAMIASQMIEKGWEFREDIIESLVTGYAAALPKDPIQQAQITVKLEKLTPNLCRNIEAHNEPTALIGVASWIIKLVDESLLLDQDSTAVLSSLMFIEEAREDDIEKAWNVSWAEVNSTVSKLLTYCRLQGLYLVHKT